MPETVLELDDLTVRFRLRRGDLTAVDGVSFSIGRGETFGLVGESGSGKSVTARAIMRLIPDPPGEIQRGRILFGGDNVLDKSAAEMRALRGRHIAMVFQEPMSALNPVFTVCEQISDALRTNLGLSKQEARERVVELLALVGIPSPQKRLDSYVHEFSGGMRQRVMLAMALSCNPGFLIADEPTTALDVTIQATILELITS
ncbi:MAG: ABC transporter ATP-binding protein, partial [Reyranella sp.]|nr:ABC transporter ATP-binding protein [Reyranella sp.]